MRNLTYTRRVGTKFANHPVEAAEQPKSRRARTESALVPAGSVEANVERGDPTQPDLAPGRATRPLAVGEDLAQSETPDELTVADSRLHLQMDGDEDDIPLLQRTDDVAVTLELPDRNGRDRRRSHGAYHVSGVAEERLGGRAQAAGRPKPPKREGYVPTRVRIADDVVSVADSMQAGEKGTQFTQPLSDQGRADKPQAQGPGHDRTAALLSGRLGVEHGRVSDRPTGQARRLPASVGAHDALSPDRLLLPMTDMEEQPLPLLVPSPRSRTSLDGNVFDDLTVEPVVPLPTRPVARFGRYQVLGRLASGGMADIFLAVEETASGARRHVALKLMRENFRGDPEVCKMFLREGRVAMRLSHPHICPVYEVGELHGRLFMAMEWVRGASLVQMLARSAQLRRKLSAPVVASLIAQVAAALDHVHRLRDTDGQRMNLVHRDVSPHNIMISYDGSVKLLDFGVVKMKDADHETRTATVKGKVGYMSPEQCQGKALDGRSDIFSLGVCLYEALTSRRLYKGKTDFATFQAILQDPVPSLRRVDSTLPEALERVVHRALSKSPARRYQRAAEMELSLQEYLADRGEIVNASRLRGLMRELFASEIADGPKLDRGRAVAQNLGVDPANEQTDSGSEPLPLEALPLVPPSSAASRGMSAVKFWTLLWIVTGAAAAAAYLVGEHLLL